MYIIFFSKSAGSQYVFLQWIEYLCHQQNVRHGIKLLIYVLEESGLSRNSQNWGDQRLLGKVEGFCSR